MALDSRAHPHANNNNNTSFYNFGGSSSSANNHQAADLLEEELSLSQVGFHKLAKSSTNNNHYLKLHHLSHMMHGGSSGKVLSDSNDGGSSLITFEDSSEAAVGGTHGYENESSECLNNSHQTASSFDSHLLKSKVNNRDHDMSVDWFYSSDAPHDHRATEDESYLPPNKKQCTSTATPNKKSKQAKPGVVSKDPQSIAAKNRRERISERLKILQELVPNGTKVDLVTMLEKAIGYVKFLQLQVKVLAADEFWPVQGGKAPELSQVKDAIDAILSSHRSDRNSASD